MDHHNRYSGRDGSGDRSGARTRPRSEHAPRDEARVRKPRQTAVPAQADDLAGPESSPGQAVRRMLSSRQTLRRAILLHDILGPPKALQRREERW